MAQLLSFHNDESIKKSLVKRMDDHIALDELIQGATGEGGKGCTVWCALNNGDLKRGYDHTAFPDVLGLPEWLARLQDTIFEGLKVEDAKLFSSQWVRVIPVGKNLNKVKWQFCSFILKENIERVLTLEISEDLKKQVVDAINGCLSLHVSAIETGEWNESAAESAESAVESARSAEWSAWSAVRSAWSAAWSARSAARSAAESARSAAGSAAWSAAWSAWSAVESARSAAGSAGSAAYKRYADELLRLLSEA